MRTPTLRQAGAGVAAVACGGLVAGVMSVPTATAVTVAPAAAPQPVLPTDATLPDPWTDKGGASVSTTGGNGSTISESGGGIRVFLKGADMGIRTRPDGSASGLKKGSLASAWRGLDGRVKGVVTGKTKGGTKLTVPVWFSSAGLTVNKNGVGVNAYFIDEGLTDKVQDAFPQLGRVKSKAIGAKMSYVAIHGTDGDARSWRFTSAGSSGKVSQISGERYSVRVNKAQERGAGVQMGQESATLPWSYIDDKWEQVTGKGVPAILLVQGLGKNGKTRTVALRPESMTDGKNLGFKASLLHGINNAKQAKALRSMRGVSATLVASNSGHEKRYVVITGDSISSGESGRYLADYEGAGWNDLTPTLNFKKFCDYGDLACTESTYKGPDQDSFDYDEKLTDVYEKGTQKAGECHRSYSAPGTWLARYFAVEKSEKVEAINIACSGATTAAITKTYNGQMPQAEELEGLTNFLHVPYVTNTMGANDIGFSAVAIACYLAVAEPFLGDEGGGGGLADLISKVGEVIDAPWNGWFGYRMNDAKDGFEKYDPYCHSKKSVGEAAEDAIKKLPEKYEDAMGKLLKAAPESKVVAANYPNLIPHNSQSNFPKARILADDGVYKVVSELAQLGNLPEEPRFDGPDKMTFDELKANRLAWANYWESSLTGFIAFGAFRYPLLATMNLLLEKDMNWAAWKMIPDLNDAVYNTAGNFGKRVIPVDMRQSLNGREYSGAYKGTSETDDQFRFGQVSQDNLGGVGHMAYTNDDPNSVGYGVYDPKDLRSTFVTGPLAGLPFNVPVLCPSGVTLNGDKLPDSTCLGYMNEPLHPNWRGQAAQGQCYVAVVTGMLGDGNACVRSVGANEWGVPPESVDFDTFDFRVSYLMNIDDGDRLCVTDKPRTDYDWKDTLPEQPYTDCSSQLAADPTWDASRWKTVTDNGNWK